MKFFGLLLTVWCLVAAFIYLFGGGIPGLIALGVATGLILLVAG